MTADKLQAFPWYGGKRTHLDFILPNLPQKNGYLEPFGGSAAVLLSREPANVETYNDLDGDVTMFFKVLRDQPDELIRQLERTPYSRSEYEDAIDAAGDESLDDLERARLFFVRAGQVYAGLAQYATPGRWSYSVKTSDRGQATETNSWEFRVDKLDRVADRLRRVQIECDNAVDVIERYEDPETVIYVDPPYPLEARGRPGISSDPIAYANEMTGDDHREVAEVLNSTDAYVAVSSYRNELYDELFKGWKVAEGPEKKLKTKHESEEYVRREVLYTNYDPARVVRGFNQSDLTAFGETPVETDGGRSE